MSNDQKNPVTKEENKPNNLGLAQMILQWAQQNNAKSLEQTIKQVIKDLKK